LKRSLKVRRIFLATDAAILTTTETAADAQGTTQAGVKRQETITPPFSRELPKVPDKALLAVKCCSAQRRLAAAHPSERKAKEHPMSLQIGDTAPDFQAETTDGPMRFHEWVGDSWAVLFSHPKDFTPVCTTELGYMARIKPEFDRRNVKIVGLSVDPVENHAKWAIDIKETQGTAPNYPMIGDTDLSIAKAWGMLPATTSGDASVRSATDNQTVRNVFVVGPDKKIKLILVYPMTTGRNFDEVLRVIDSLQLTAAHKVATPVQWKNGEDVIITGAVSDEEAKKIYPAGWNEPRPYLRIVPQPKE
jgi:alkyl hydroperoxide reductase subunit AhpC